MAMTIEDHHIMQKCLDEGIRIYSNHKNQVIVEKNGLIQKIFNLSKRDKPSEKIIKAYKYYHSRNFEI